MLSDFSVSTRILCVERRSELPWNFQGLSAPYWRFYWNIGGVGRVFGLASKPGEAFSLELNKGYLIPPDTEFSSESDGPIDQFFIHFSLDRWPHVLEHGIYQLENSVELAPLVNLIINDVARENALVHDRRRALHDSRSALMASGLVLSALAGIPAHEKNLIGLNERVQRAMDFISRSTERSVSADEISAVAGCGERSLRRLFIDTLGVTAVEYAVSRRIEQACILLHFTDETIDQIADRTGFCDRYHFSRVFVRNRGMGPAAFRRVAMELNPSSKRRRTHSTSHGQDILRRNIGE